MSQVEESAAPAHEDVVLRVPPEHVDDFRVMLREQIAGDIEALRDHREGRYGRRRDDAHLGELDRRIGFLWSLAALAGGLF